VTKGSDLLVAALKNEGVACIFAIPGEETIFDFSAWPSSSMFRRATVAHIRNSPSERTSSSAAACAYKLTAGVILSSLTKAQSARRFEERRPPQSRDIGRCFQLRMA
jgi:thiamine pyrophosphate-dependent acetolactate synthase large subunit-like protein